jgi:hypothetical protein
MLAPHRSIQSGRFSVVKSLVFSLALILILASVAVARETLQAEFFPGYNLARVNVDSVPARSTSNGVKLQPHSSWAAPAPRTGGRTASAIGGNAKDRRAELWFLPDGGTLPSSRTNSRDASALPVGNLACPR